MVEYQLPKLGTRVRFPSLAPLIRFYQDRGGFLGAAVLICCFLQGCATVEDLPSPGIRDVQAAPPQGVYHKIKDNETIWRIAKAYNVSIDQIIEINRIPDISKVEVNQLIFIPGATQIKEIQTENTSVPDANKDEFAWPAKGRVVDSFQRGSGYLNKGIGIEVDGSTVVKASRQGKVVLADYLVGYDYTVILDHMDGFHSVYAKNRELKVKTGDFVNKGDELGRVGTSGRRDVFHFEIRKDGRANNPLYYLPRI